MIKLFRNILVIACLGFFSIASAEMQYKGVIYPKDATNGYFMYYTTAGGLVNSPLSSDGTNVTNTGTLTSGTMTIGSGSITDSSGNITFVNENLVTTGTLGTGAITGPSLANAAALTLSSSGAGVNVTTHSDAGDDFTVNATTLVVEGDTGNVGIGTASPEITLEVYGTAHPHGILVKKEDDTGNGSYVNFTHNRTNAADDDNIGTLAFNGLDDASNSAEYGRISVISADVSNGSEDGQMSFNLSKAGSANQNVMTLVDGNVGIGTSNPLESLHVVSNTSGQGIRFERTSATSGRYTFGLTSGGDFQIDETGVAGRLRIAKTTGNIGIGTTNPSSPLHISKSTVPQLRISSNETNSTRKNALIGLTSYTTAEEVFCMMYADTNTGANNELNIGGGTSAVNSASMIRFYTSSSVNTTTGTERMRILPTGGITFNGDTAAANALDDYKEGTWTPVFKIGTTSNVQSSNGEYTKIGNLVHISGRIYISATLSGSGVMTITGVPYTCGTSSGKSTIYTNDYIDTSNMILTLSGSTITLHVQSTSTTAGLRNADVSLIHATNNGKYIYIQMTYSIS
jgi:hypothetical protein